MDTYIALIRGINVGGKNVLLMKNLAKILEGMGCEKVKTYKQSGNMVFQAKKIQAKRFAKDIGAKIYESHRFKPTVLLLEASELEESIENNPFKPEDEKALHFFFLESTPIKPDLMGLMNVKSNSEKFELKKSTFYLFAPNGVGRSKLAAKVENALKVPVTARNWNTVNSLNALAKQLQKD